VQDEFILSYSVELGEPSFGEGPEGLYSVDVALAADELVGAMKDTVMVVAVKDEAVVGFPAVRVDRAALEHFPLYDRHQCGPAGRGDDRHEHLAATLEQSEHGRLPGCSAASLAPDSASAEVGLVDLNFARQPHDLLVLP